MERDADYWIRTLSDPRSFSAWPEIPAHGALTEAPEIRSGFANVAGRPVAIYAHDTQENLGFISSKGSKRIHALMQEAVARRVPIVAFLASPGVSVDEGLASGEEYTRVIMANVSCSGDIPQFAMVMGVVMGGAAYSSQLMDFTFFNRARSHLMVSGPAVVKAAIGEQTTLSQLGGSALHAKSTGMAHFLDRDIEGQILRLKRLLSYLPSHAGEVPPRIAAQPPRADIPPVPFEIDVSYDMEGFLAGVLDGSESLPYCNDYGRSLITAFARIGGVPVGVVANQSKVLSGAISAEAAQKAARFISLCDTYGLPIIMFIDVPGYMIGSAEERKAIILHGAGMIRSLRTRVAKYSVVVRRCYGAAAFVMMQTAAQGGSLVLALERSRIAIMGFHAAKDLVYRDEAAGSDSARLKTRYYEEYENPQVARKAGVVDEVVSPEDVRARLIQELSKGGAGPAAAPSASKRPS